MYYMMSIHSCYADKILSGEKNVEIRRSIVHMKKGDHVAIYATRPVAQIVGLFVVKDVLYDTPKNIWNKYKNESCIPKKDYDLYSAGKKRMSAIIISSAKRVVGEKIKEINCHIPQSYIRISEECFYDLCQIYKGCE